MSLLGRFSAKRPDGHDHVGCGCWVRSTAAVAGSVAALLLGGCEGIQSVLDPHGPEARQIARITWFLVVGAGIILFLVTTLALFALLRPEQRGWIGSSGLIIAGGLVFPIVTLAALLVYSLVAAGVRAPAGSDVLEIEVTGYRWWWEVNYLDSSGDVAFTSANEIRMPVGRPVLARVSTADVIHAFWIPNLAGKIDMIPGRINELPLQADAAGTFRGQCTEYCGGPHAWMAFYVVAEEPERYAQWFEGQRQPARVPQSPLLQRGQELFLSNGCGACHTVRGIEAEGRLGPDLTHVGSRLTIGAGMLTNSIDNLTTWIAHSQRVKPDNLMPSFDTLSKDDLQALAAYLESLK